MDDPHDLQRFLDAQAPVYAAVTAELAAGAKRTHWMWFIFPQLRGLGQSAMAQRYGIASQAEAEAYLRHPVLGPRLIECSALVLQTQGRSAEEILGGIDAVKLRSCMTLFAAIDGTNAVFDRVLRRFFAGAADPRTLNLLR
jgi:uncharacterized protein (DUF1810 family)